MLYHYYIGISLPSPLHEMIAAVQTKLFDQHRAIPPLEPHITLLPPPAVERISPDQLTPYVRNIADSFLPLEVRLEKVVTFGSHAVAIEVSSAELHALQQQLTHQLATLLPMRQRSGPPFRPHVTLNQAIRGQRLPDSLLQAYRQQLEPQLPAQCRIEHLTLYRWQKPRTYSAQAI